MKNLIKMLNALTSAYSRKDHDTQQQLLPLETNIGKLFSILAWGLDSVQEQAELIRLWDDLEYARGSVLDRYGSNFGIKRVSSDDRFYRLTIKVKMMALLSGGDIDTVLNAAAELFEIPIERIILDEIFPSRIRIVIQEADLSFEVFAVITSIKTMIKRLLPAGVGIDLNVVLKPPAFQESSGSLYLHRLWIMANFCDIRDMPVRFAGAIDFGGAIQFNQTTKGFSCQRFLVRCQFVALQSGITYLTTFKARFPIQNTVELLSCPVFRIVMAADELWKDCGFSGMKIRLSAAHEETSAGKLTMDNRRIFDGSISFNGLRQFDAYYVKEEF